MSRAGSGLALFRIPFTRHGKTGLILLDQIRTVDKVSFEETRQSEQRQFNR